MRTVDDVVACLDFHDIRRLPKPPFSPNHFTNKVACAVPSMKTHMSDEGWQLMQALESAGYTLRGYNLGGVDLRPIIDSLNPGTVVMQDKREWDWTCNKLAHRYEKFNKVTHLRREHHPEIFKLTIVKDAHQRPEYHSHSAEEIDCHAWIIYYHPRIVTHLARYIRPEHAIRTYHSIDPALIPKRLDSLRKGCLLSGAISAVYPLRRSLFQFSHALHHVDVMFHPGYVNNRCFTPDFLKRLTHYKVAICTSSLLGYSLRKLIEATACGCRVITDLPVDDVLPEIDENLVRVPNKFESGTHLVEYFNDLLNNLYSTYDSDRQKHFADLAKKWYDYRAVGKRLSDDIETLRSNY